MGSVVGKTRASGAETWTLVQIPDTQRLAANNPTAYNNLIQWIVDNKVTEDIRMVMHLGDYCNNGASATEWGRVDTAMNRLHGEVPFIHNSGNHDYDDDAKGGVYTRLETNWDAVFPESDWTGYDWYVDCYNNVTTNMAAKLEIGGIKYLFIALEFFPRAAVFTWAANVIANNPADRIIMTTHAMLDPDRLFMTEDRPSGGGGQAGNPKYYSVCNYSENADCKTGQEIFDEFVSNYNVVLIGSGHDVASADVESGYGVSGQSAFASRRDVVGGKPINSHLFNYQNISANSYANSAYLRLYRFDHSDNTVAVETYNPVQDTNLTDAQNQFEFIIY